MRVAGVLPVVPQRAQVLIKTIQTIIVRANPDIALLVLENCGDRAVELDGQLAEKGPAGVEPSGPVGHANPQSALAVRIDGKAYYVDGTSIDKHGDAHSADGFCLKVRTAKVEGEVVENRFQVKSFELLPLAKAQD